MQERNKPKEAPKAPEKAPFFLPSLLGKDDTNPAVEGAENGKAGKPSSNDAATERSRIARIQSEQGVGLGGPRFNALLRSGSESGNFEPFVEFLKALPPAKADLEIRSLDPRIRSGRCELVDFVTVLTGRLRMKRDFELVNAWMAVFLKVHADILGDWSASTDDEHQVAEMLREALAVWKSEEQREAKRLAALMSYCRGVVGFLRSAR